MDRLKDIKPFIVMDIVAEASKYPDAIHFEIGEPDLQPPPAVWEMTEKAVKDRLNYYTESLGLPQLRERIAQHYWDKYKVEVNPSNIALTVGTSGAFLVAYSITLNQGDKIALPDPSYPCYKNFAHLLDIQPIMIPVDETTDYQLTVEHLKDYPDIKAVHISSPSNPVGNVYTKENLQALAQYCEENGIYLISDEIYHGLTYGVEDYTAVGFSKKAIVINGFSKYFCMPGFRLGWIILPDELVRKGEIVLQNVYISPPTISQYGALGSFDYKHLEKNRKIFEERRDFLYSSLKELFTIPAKPTGAFYIWADASRYTDDTFQFSKRILQETHTAITPGIDFGNNKTNLFLRFAYTRDIDHMKEGIERLKGFLS
ncbi:MAG: aminotransferase class I/II-fold pyridoxal phosphate-dependent enzyme [Aquificae bacterium]|nr:aminotransferase class I/II-fold pyridoxal phosphate-dependent enzyme [Aquificota bacterium]